MGKPTEKPEVHFLPGAKVTVELIDGASIKFTGNFQFLVGQLHETEGRKSVVIRTLPDEDGVIAALEAFLAAAVNEGSAIADKYKVADERDE